MAVKIQIRRGTASQWTTKNTILSDGEMGYEKDTGRCKFGNGVTAWNDLDYFSGSTSTSQYRGAHNPSGANDYPDPDQGSGVGGAIKAGDHWYLLTGGTFNSEDWPPDSVFTARIDAPGSTHANWLKR